MARGPRPRRRPSSREAGVESLRMPRQASEAPRGSRVALYMRVSTRHQDIASQERRLHEEAARRGLVVVHKYIDHGISGAKGREARPALDAMLLDATSGRFDTIMVFKLDRLGRSLKDLLTILSILQDNKRNLVVVDQDIDTSTPFGRIIFQVSGIFAEYERAMISERVVAGIAATKAKGTELGRRAVMSPQEVAEAAATQARGATLRELAARYGVSPNTVSLAIKRLRRPQATQVA